MCDPLYFHHFLHIKYQVELKNNYKKGGNSKLYGQVHTHVSLIEPCISSFHKQITQTGNYKCRYTTTYFKSTMIVYPQYAVKSSPTWQLHGQEHTLVSKVGSMHPNFLLKVLQNKNYTAMNTPIYHRLGQCAGHLPLWTEELQRREYNRVKPLLPVFLKP